MFGIALVVGTSDERLRLLLSVVSIGSLVGCGILYLLARRLQRDVSIFQELNRANRSLGG